MANRKLKSNRKKKSPARPNGQRSVETTDHQCTWPGCPASFKTKRQLIKHKIAVHGFSEGQFICDFQGCGKRFRSRGSLYQHKQLHKDGDFKCTFEGCDKSFKTAKYLKNHLISHSEKKFECLVQDCDMKFRSQRELSRHMENHSDIRKYRCAIENCDQSFKTRKGLNRHTLEVHTKEKSFSCTFQNCGRKFSSQGRLNEHLKRHNKTTPEVNPQQNSRKKKEDSGRLDSLDLTSQVNSQRPLSVNKSKEKMDMNRFQESISKNNLQEVGSNSFVSQDVSNEDFSHEPNGMAELPEASQTVNFLEPGFSTNIINSQELYVCGVCGQIFASGHALKLHQKNTCPGLKCQICGETFPYPRALILHVAIHHQERKLYQCMVCSANYLNNENLKKHQVAQHKVRGGPIVSSSTKHRCSICKTLFTGASLFEHVVRCHEKMMTRKRKFDVEKDVQCSICSYDVKLANYAAHVHMDMYLYYMPRNKWVGKLLCKSGNCEFKARDFSQYRLHLFAHDISFESWKQHKKCDKCDAIIIHKRRCPFYKKRQSNKKLIKMTKRKLQFIQRKEKLTQRPDVYHCGCCNVKVSTRLEMLSHYEKIHGLEISICTEEKEPKEDQQGFSVCFICTERFFCPVATHFHVKSCQQRHGFIRNSNGEVLVKNGDKKLRDDEDDDNADNSTVHIGEPKLVLVTC